MNIRKEIRKVLMEDESGILRFGNDFIVDGIPYTFIKVYKGPLVGAIVEDSNGKRKVFMTGNDKRAMAYILYSAQPLNVKKHLGIKALMNRIGTINKMSSDVENHLDNAIYAIDVDKIVGTDLYDDEFWNEAEEANDWQRSLGKSGREL